MQVSLSDRLNLIREALPINQSLAHIALFVRDYDEAIAFYVDVLNFDLVADEYQPEQGNRWVVVRPKGDGAAGLVLKRASNDHQAELIGYQA